jgi:3-oxoacyl-[acyl-carrier-protein] synthase-3
MMRENSKQRATGRLNMHYAHIVGWGMALPENIVTNDDLSAIVETNDEWIATRTGIRARRIANERESTSTLAYEAARQALEVANILPTDIDLIIVATSTSDHVFPSTASMVQDMLGAGKAGAFDLSAACSGFVYGLHMGADSIRAGSSEYVLVIGAETMSRVLDWQDRSTCILFGDGAGAVLLKASEQEGGILSSVLRSDGAGYDLLAIPTVNNPTPKDHKINKMYMAGGEVFKFATRVVDDSIRQCVSKAGLDLTDIDLVIPHQANQRILMSAARKLNIDISKWMSNLENYGNTSAASIPIALCEAIEQNRIAPNDHLVMVGFGGGLAWAAMAIKWTPLQTEAQRTRLTRQRRRAFYVLARLRARWQRTRRNWNKRLTKFFRNTSR